MVSRFHRLLLAAFPIAIACAPDQPPAERRPSSPDSVVAPVAALPTATLVAVPTYGKAYPTDQASRDPGFLAFRDSLLRIVARRDTTALFAVMAPQFKSSFGENDDMDGFHRAWRPGDADTELWTVLDDVLRHGGRFLGPDVFYAPYTFLALPDSLDAFDHLIVRDSGVVVRERPDSASTAIALLSFDIVKAGPYSSDTPWTAIALGDDRIGYVDAGKIRSAVDYRAGFERRDGRWLLVFLLAGD